MALPKASCPTREVDGVEVRGLTRAEVKSLSATGEPTPEQAEAFEVGLVTYGCNVTKEEAEEWLATAGLAQVKVIIEAIVELSGLGDTPNS